MNITLEVLAQRSKDEFQIIHANGLDQFLAEILQSSGEKIRHELGKKLIKYLNESMPNASKLANEDVIKIASDVIGQLPRIADELKLQTTINTDELLLSVMEPNDSPLRRIIINNNSATAIERAKNFNLPTQYHIASITY